MMLGGVRMRGGARARARQFISIRYTTRRHVCVLTRQYDNNIHNADGGRADAGAGEAVHQYPLYKSTTRVRADEAV